MFDEFKKETQKIENRIKSIKKMLNIDDKISKAKTLETETYAEGFWNDNDNARKIMQKIDRLKSDIHLYENLEQNFNDIKVLVELADEEQEESMIKDIEYEISDLKKKINKISFRLKLSGKTDKNSAILTLNAGAGGTESCDWVDMLTRMYQQWSTKNKYKTEIIDILPGDEAGIKRIMMMIEGDYAYGYLKSEVGIHRLVRVSPFDSSNRRHTSFAACDVIPSITDDIDIKINENDLKVDTYRASGHGGQHVNKTDSAVRITHLPSGIVVQCQDSPSQHSNRKKAILVLKAKLYEYEEDKKRAAAQRRYDEKGEIGWGHQIRSYVFMPYQMVKDHRTDFKVSNVEAVMNGEIDGFIEAYLEQNA